MLVMLDPGHGGSDPGAIGPTGLKEKDVTLRISNIAKDKLHKNGFQCLITRYQDQEVSLGERAWKANGQQVDVFVSIHCNAAKKSTACGTEVYHCPRSQKGIVLATSIYKSLISQLGRRERGVKGANFAVLKWTKMPACLAEVAFISNPEEEELLKDKVFLEKTADAICEGIVNYAKEDSSQ